MKFYFSQYRELSIQRSNWAVRIGARYIETRNIENTCKRMGKFLTQNKWILYELYNSFFSYKKPNQQLKHEKRCLFFCWFIILLLLIINIMKVLIFFFFPARFTSYSYLVSSEIAVRFYSFVLLKGIFLNVNVLLTFKKHIHVFIYK